MTTEALKEWKRKNREKINAQQRAHRETPEGREKAAARMREYRKTAKNIEYRRNHNATNRAHNTQVHRDWVAKNKCHLEKYCAEYREKNRAKLSANQSRWQKENPEYARLNKMAYKARKAGLMGSVSPGIVGLLMLEQAGKCPYCIVDLMTTKVHLDHFMPMALGGVHDDSNLQLVCRSCNCRKSHTHPAVFLERVMR